MRENKHTQNDELIASNSTFQEFIKLFRDLVVIFIVMTLLRIFIITPFKINGQSMEPSYQNNEFILVNKFSYLNFSKDLEDYKNDTNLKWLISLWRKIPLHIGDPKRGDVVVIRPHVDQKREYYIKRVIAIPGDTIKFEEGHIFIKKKGEDRFVKINESYLNDANKGHTYLPEYVEKNQFLVPDDAYWVMGDNRNNSADSRSCFQTCYGVNNNAYFIKRHDVVGKVLLSLWYFRIFGDDWMPDWGNIWPEVAPKFFSSASTAQYPELENTNSTQTTTQQ